MKNKFGFLMLFALFTIGANAKVKLPEIVGDNMVLQQNTKVKLWGDAAPNKPVTVKASWSNENFRTQSDKDGKWLLWITTPAGSYENREISISDGEKVTLKNILIGEVWFCSGQSNMEMPLNGFWNCPIQGANEAIATASQNKGIRFATISKVQEFTPQSSVQGKWQICNPENAAWFSATAYHFATSLNRALDVPVGIINCSWGGSKVESWTNREILETYKDVDLSKEAINKTDGWLRPLVMYNGMLKPLTNYTIKGFLWYQGESNVGKHDTYAQRLANMVELWRKDWGLGNLPFYYVEIAPYQYGEGNWGAFLREAQYKAQFLISNSGMISTNDLVEEYEASNIHPKNKTSVGKRLSYMALNRTYGYKTVECNGPEYKSMEVKDGKAYLSFNYTQDGFSREKGINGFEIAGADKIFHPATAVADLNKKTIVVSCEEVQEPVAVRYCFRNFLIGNIYNNRELPMVPFRTDNY
jgi:sialate O-acetylesterase